MGGRVLRQVVDTPVSLPGPRRIDFGRFLAGQHQEPSLGVVMLLARWRALRTVLESIETVLSEAMAPDKDRAYGQTHVLRDRRVGLTGGDTQDDLGTIRVLLGRCTCGHAALQFGAFGGQQTNTSTTWSGTRYVRVSFRCFSLQPARLGMNSTPTSTNRTEYYCRCRGASDRPARTASFRLSFRRRPSPKLNTRRDSSEAQGRGRPYAR